MDGEGHVCLNPYYTGIHLADNDFYGNPRVIVLILIILEYT